MLNGQSPATQLKLIQTDALKMAAFVLKLTCVARCMHSSSSVAVGLQPRRRQADTASTVSNGPKTAARMGRSPVK